jgi:tetratricopeptide (TPR) repeat protein
MHEAQIQSRLVHPNICRIYDVDNSGGVPKIAMQLVRGPTLSQVAAELSIRDLAVILAQVAEAIHAAHRLNLIHRDLKPSNILLERSPEGRWAPFVCDFGLAVALDEPSLTLGPGLLGTPAFMAPEQRRGERQLVGPATDIYALGATLHFALYGEPPLQDPDSLPAAGRAALPPGRHGGGELPRDLDTILGKCLEPDPGLRYPTALALAEDLWLFADGAPIHARPVGVLEHRWRQLRQYRMVVLAALLAAGVVLTGRLVEKGLLTQRQRARAQAEQSFALEAADLEKEIRLEKMLPVHDLRPVYARVRRRMGDIRARMDNLGAEAQAPGHYALGVARCLLGDYAGAKAELQQAWAGGFQRPEVAWCLALCLVGASRPATSEAVYATGLPPPGLERLADQVQAFALQGSGAEGSSPDIAEALVAYARGDYRRAAQGARAAFVARPWQFEAALLESLAHSSLGWRLFEAGDLGGAEAAYRDAMEASRRFLAVGHSDAASYHAYLLAGRRLAFLQARQGRLAQPFLDGLLEAGGQALELDPTDPEIQDDWLMLRLLEAYHLQDGGRDPGPVLDAALAFMNTWVRPPLTAELRADRMLLHWRRAERIFRQGGNPDAELAEALADPGHTGIFRQRDMLGDVLNFKARVERSRDRDPRPTVAAALAGIQPALERHASWTLCETAAEAWLIQAEWEDSRGLDARSSLQRGRALVDMAREINGRSRHGRALQEQFQVLAERLDPDARRPGPRPQPARPRQGSGDRAPGIRPATTQARAGVAARPLPN